MRFLTGAALPKFEGSTSNKQDESQKFEASASGYNYLSVIKNLTNLLIVVILFFGECQSSNLSPLQTYYLD